MRSRTHRTISGSTGPSTVPGSCRGANMLSRPSWPNRPTAPANGPRRRPRHSDENLNMVKQIRDLAELSRHMRSPPHRGTPFAAKAQRLDDDRETFQAKACSRIILRHQDRISREANQASIPTHFSTLHEPYRQSPAEYVRFQRQIPAYLPSILKTRRNLRSFRMREHADEPRHPHATKLPNPRARQKYVSFARLDHTAKCITRLETRSVSASEIQTGDSLLDFQQILPLGNHDETFSIKGAYYSSSNHVAHIISDVLKTFQQRNPNRSLQDDHIIRKGRIRGSDDCLDITWRSGQSTCGKYFFPAGEYAGCTMDTTRIGPAPKWQFQEESRAIKHCFENNG